MGESNMLAVRVPVSFLNSKYAPRCSIFSGRTDGLKREGFRLKEAAWDSQKRDRFFLYCAPDEVFRNRWGRGLVEVGTVAGVMAVAIRTMLLALNYQAGGQVTLWGAGLLLIGFTAVMGLFTVLAGVLSNRILAHAATWYWDRKEEVLVILLPRRLAAVQTAFQQAYEKYVADGSPPDEVEVKIGEEEDWNSEVAPGWDATGEDRRE